MIRTVLTLPVKPGEADALVSTFRRLGILETSAAQEGCLSTEISIAEDGSHAVVTATWRDREAYGVWTSRTDRGSHSAEISRHLREPLTPQTVGVIYDVAHRPESV